MRSQQEILNKINELQKSGADPMKCQVKMLVRKLIWSNAVDFLPAAKKHDPAVMKRWDQTSCLDKKVLIGEIGELMYQAYDAVIEFNFKKCLIFIQVFMVFSWLLRDDTMMREIIHKLNSSENVPLKYKKFLFKGLFDLICTNFGLRWQIYCREWELADPPPEEGKIIT